MDTSLEVIMKYKNLSTYMYVCSAFIQLLFSKYCEMSFNSLVLLN